jgi:hypothetical protein
MTDYGRFMRKPQEKSLDETLAEAVARGKRERLFIAVMTRSASALLGNIIAGFGELARPLTIERMLEVPIIAGGEGHL